MITHHPIEWWTKKFQEPFSLARFGDGEFNCIEGKKGANSHGCEYTPELRADLIACLSAPFLKGIQRILPRQLHKIRPLLQGEWVDTEVWSEALSEGKMKPVFDVLRQKHLVIVSSAEKDKFPIPHDFIETPFANAHTQKNDIVKAILGLKRPGIFLIACGMASGPIVHALHGQIPGASFVDIGHVLDPFIGLKSRDYLKSVPNDVILRNL